MPIDRWRMCAVAPNGIGRSSSIARWMGQAMATVLVIEDNPVNMKLAVLLLRNAGHAVLCAGDAETGLRRVRAEHPDLILMDIQLPGMDGMAAVALLKQDPTTASIPVIALTAMEMEVDRENGQLAGCAAYIVKPLRYQELYAAIDRLCVTAHLATAGRHVLRADRPQAGSVLPVDVRILEGLIGSDPVLIREFQDAFRISADSVALDLRAACDAGQAMLAGRQAHKLKASAQSVGALALAELCAEMEAAGKAGMSDVLAALLPRFERELDAVHSFFNNRPEPQADIDDDSFV